MKAFDLQEALNGELAQLRNGYQARIVYVHNDKTKDVYERELEHKLVGFVMNKDGLVIQESESWTLDGRVVDHNEDHPYDIIGMFEIRSRLEVLNEAWERNLQVRSLDTGAIYNVYAKTKDNDFVLQSVNVGQLSRLLFANFELVEEQEILNDER